MMTFAGAAFYIMFWLRGGDGLTPSLLWGLPFLLSCIMADAGAAAGMAGIEALTKAGTDAIIKARLSWRNRQ